VARIPDHVIEQINEEVSLVRLAELAGVELRSEGEGLIGTCPFHPDEGSTLVVSPEANAWRCAVCEAGGQAIEWTMRVEGVSFRHAAELLRDGALPSAKGSRRPARSTAAKLPPLLAAGAEERELLERVVGFYAETLRESPEALAYLERRGLGDPALIERFRPGYANRTLGYRLPAKNRKAGAELRGKLADLGILRDSGHEHLAGSLVIPVCDKDGAVVQLYGRKVQEKLRAGTPRHLYLPGPKGIFNAAALGAGSEAIVCESPIDALTFWANGLRHVVATPGPQEGGEELCAALTDAGTRRVLVAFDADREGERGAKALAASLNEVGIECARVRFPSGEDPNAFACAAADPPVALADALSEATPIGAVKVSAPQRALRAPLEEAEPAPAPGEPGDESSSASRSLRAPVEEDPGPPPPEGKDGSSGAMEPPSPPPQAPIQEPVIEAAGDELRIRIAERRWRVRGIGKATSFESLRVNVLIARKRQRLGEVFHVDSLDLYSARARGTFARAASKELGLSEDVVARDMGRVLMACEEHAEHAVREAQAPAEPEVELSEAERERALSLLRDPALIERVCADFARIGVVGEETNCLIGYLAAVSRKLDRPLAVLVQSTSAAGKSALQEAVLAMVPSEERVSFSAMTGQSLFYMGETDLSHKVLAIAEEEGAKRAAYALKLLHSEGELRIASTGKEGQTGRLITHTYTVRGPVAIFLTTTTIEVDEELLNRCVVLSVDEERSQTRAIHERQRQRETLEGVLAERERASVLALHRDAQRLLAPLAVVNPYAPRLTFADARTRTRRDHMKYLTLIRAIALLHQHQRPQKTATTPSGEELPYIEVTRSDIVLANRLAHAVLGRSLDELPPGTRRLLGLIEAHVAARADAERVARDQVRFTRRELREALGWGDTQLKVHLARLVALELVWAHRGPHRSYLYELAWDGGSEERPHLPGLIDPDRLGGEDEGAGEPGRAEAKGERSAQGRAPVGARSGRGHEEGG
jgi:DNA primase catalytic core